MKQILLPTDFSDNSWSAIVYALKLYANETCAFYFLHSWSFLESTSRTYITSTYVDQLKEKSIKELNELKGRVEVVNKNPNHAFQVIHTSEVLQDAIETAIKKYNIDMIIMGTKGATGAKEFFFGSNTVNTIQKIKQCPILIIPDGLDFVEPKQITFPTDFKRFYGDEILELIQLSSLYDSQIRVLHINKEDKLTDLQIDNMGVLKKYLKNNEYSFHWMPDYAKKSETIHDFIEELEINILVMIKYEHNIIENIINEPVIKKLGFQVTIPFLVIPSAS
ncbi:universal stress protein [Winogradskyella psychrotolerans]|uniref:universal stress protein n=1 Tax=Winogradskyella psychrotolerans TaxID=1344585 RepID=UPI001C076943|nr:universal stress protein [Winogradskyella psychrotolerans]MBU2920533.1 universal stress protein [Winogradskyella psychrotolerans]